MGFLRSWTVFAIVLAAAALGTGGASPEVATASQEPPPKVSIVMLGDSITYGGKWADLLGREDIVNLGIIGDSTQGFIDRLPEVYRHRPRIVFIMGGVNDIAGGVPVEAVFTNLRLIIQSLRVRHIIPVVQSTLFTRIRRFNPRIERLNKMLDRYARKFHVDYIDLNASLTSNRLLQRKYTFDGIHLRPAAYEEWRRPVLETLERYRIAPLPVALPAQIAPSQPPAPPGGRAAFSFPVKPAAAPPISAGAGATPEQAGTVQATPPKAAPLPELQAPATPGIRPETGTRNRPGGGAMAGG